MATAEPRQTRAAAARQSTAADDAVDIEACFLKSFFAELGGGGPRPQAGVAAALQGAAPARRRPE